ncbi:TBP-associated factor 4 isoform X2 [Leptinotarsa decemlineata]|uniref:TBP-associated factor 4 isoform X2 n=1 Tax=Leptinotarsa decemlineata TaxID=7539 RepID=UPI003D309E4C
MASASFLEEALSTDVDESAVSAIVGSLENQLVTSTPPTSGQTGSAIVINQNHINSAISNGGTVVPQKHGTIANGDSISAMNTSDGSKQVTNNAMIISGAAGAVTTGYINPSATIEPNKTSEGVKIVYTQGQANQVMTSSGTILQNRVTLPNQSLPNGTIGLPQQTVLQTNPSNVQTIQTKQPTLVLKTSGAPGAPGLVTLPMNVTSSVAQANNVGSPSTQSPNILSNLQVVNVRPGVPTQQQKGQPARVVLSTPHLVGARPGAPQLTLQSFHGLQPGQQGAALLVKTDNGFQLLRVGPAPATASINSSQAGGQPVTFRMQTVQAATVSSANNSVNASGTTTVTSTAQQTVQHAQVGQVQVQVQRPANDNTKEKCRKFLANLLELSSREPKSVERNVRTLIQELIDNKVEPEDFCDKLERLLNASPQPCLIGFLKKSLPLLRHSLATQELSIEGIRPPPSNVVFSLAGAAPSVQTVRPVIASNQVRLVAPGTAVVRPGQVIQQRLVAPIRAQGQQQTRMVTAIRQPNVANNVIVSSSQPPALHPVYPNNQQIRTGLNIRQPMQVRPLAPGQIRQQMQVRTAVPLQKQPMGTIKFQGMKPSVPSNLKPTAKDKEKKTFSSAYTGDDDINDVAAMGGVNLAEETQKILGSTEFVGTQIRSCKEDMLCSMPPLQQKIRQIMMKHGLDEPNTDVAACISHAAQERLRNLLEKLSVITEHRLENVKANQRYEITSDVKGQLKFLEDLDKAERKRHEELEREMLMRAAKSRSRTEDPEQAKLKAKAKEMQRVEMEELRQREANATALQAIGPRKKPRLDGELSGSSQANASGSNTGARGQMPLRQRMKKVTLRDLQFLCETEKDLCRSKLLYKSYLK